ncbi:hypothetical protein Q5M53_02585 [Acinetobacter baumannii]|nr:hypothetical protein [Acinetobacter baumannii]
MSMIVFPLKKAEKLDRLCLCINCGKLFVDAVDSKDLGICSLSCGYEIRGLCSRDFLTTTNQYLSQSFATTPSFAADFVRMCEGASHE